jgi:hypothetical protein
MNTSLRWILSLLFIALTLTVIALNGAGYVWAGWAPALCPAGGCSCEPARPAFIVTPLNTITNLAYVLVGLLILGTAHSSADSAAGLLRRRAGYARLFGAALIALGFGSGFFHASWTLIGQWLDSLGMYLITAFMLLFALVRLRPFSGRLFGIAYAVLCAALGGLWFAAPDARRTFFMAVLAIALLLEFGYLIARRPPVQVWLLLAGLVLFFFSDQLRAWDLQAWVCRPDSWLQPHAVYHLLSACALGLLYLYYRSERVEG